MRTYIEPTDSITADQAGRASLAVDAALIGAVYSTDQGGMPTDPQILEALRDATRCQARALAAAEGRMEAKSASIGSASFTLVERIPGGLTLPPAGGLCPDAVRVLHVAGLTPVRVSSVG